MTNGSKFDITLANVIGGQIIDPHTNEKEIIMKATFGMGVYTISDASEILGIPKPQIRYWFSRYVSGEFQKTNNEGYFYDSGKSISVNFLTLIETYVFYQLKDKGLKTSKIMKAHEVLSKHYNTSYPFALKEFLLSGSDLFHSVNGEILPLDESGQYVLVDIMMHFAENIDFQRQMASKYYPCGRDSSVVVNPKNQFGAPIIDGTNIKVSTILSLYKGGESSNFIASLYEIEEKKVEDAIKFAA